MIAKRWGRLASTLSVPECPDVAPRARAPRIVIHNAGPRSVGSGYLNYTPDTNTFGVTPDAA